MECRLYLCGCKRPWRPSDAIPHRQYIGGRRRTCSLLPRGHSKKLLSLTHSPNDQRGFASEHAKPLFFPPSISRDHPTLMQFAYLAVKSNPARLLSIGMTVASLLRTVFNGSNRDF